MTYLSEIKQYLTVINFLIDVIKDLIRYLKRDDDTHTIRRFLGQTRLLQTDLVKILIHHVENIELWDVLLRYVLECVQVELNILNCIQHVSHVLDTIQGYNVSFTYFS